MQRRGELAVLAAAVLAWPGGDWMAQGDSSHVRSVTMPAMSGSWMTVMSGAGTPSRVDCVRIEAPSEAVQASEGALLLLRRVVAETAETAETAEARAAHGHVNKERSMCRVEDGDEVGA